MVDSSLSLGNIEKNVLIEKWMVYIKQIMLVLLCPNLGGLKIWNLYKQISL